MKVLYLTEQIYLHGGAEKILIQKLNYWADVLGHQATVVTTEQKGRKPFYPLSDKVRHVDFEIDYPDGALFHPRNFSRFKEQYGKLKALIGTFQPDAVFVLTQRLFRIITPFAAKGCATFYEYHTSYYGFQLGYENSSDKGKLKMRLFNKLFRWAEDRYTGVVFLNKAEFEHFKRPNGLMVPNFFDPSAQTPDVPKKQQILSLGRLSYQKGYDLLLESWAHLEKDFPSWTLQIYGNGENHDALQAQRERLGLQHAFVNDAIDDVPQKLAESAFYVMSSRFETFPMVLLEALSASVPVVSFDCPTGPSSMLIEGSDALLAAPQDVKDLAQKMRVLMQDQAKCLEMGRKGKQNVKRFSPEQVMRQWQELVASAKTAL